MLKKQEKQYRRRKRVRAKIFGTKDAPRLCVFRSSKHIYAQLVNDEKGQTLISVSDLGIDKKAKKKKLLEGGKKEKAEIGKINLSFEVGKLIAEKALKEKINKVVFDRKGYKYHGRIKSLADGAREGGLKF